MQYSFDIFLLGVKLTALFRCLSLHLATASERTYLKEFLALKLDWNGNRNRSDLLWCLHNPLLLWLLTFRNSFSGRYLESSKLVRRITQRTDSLRRTISADVDRLPLSIRRVCALTAENWVLKLTAEFLWEEKSFNSFYFQKMDFSTYNTMLAMCANSSTRSDSANVGMLASTVFVWFFICYGPGTFGSPTTPGGPTRVCCTIVFVPSLPTTKSWGKPAPRGDIAWPCNPVCPGTTTPFWVCSRWSCI